MSSSARPENMAFLAREFLTWLWYEAARGSGIVHLDGVGPVRVDFARQLRLESPGEGGEATAVNADLPTLADEARVALQTGKKVASTTLLLDVGERHFQVAINAEAFTFSGVKLPTVLGTGDGEQLDERLALLDQLEGIVDGLYVSYARLRLDPAQWPQVRGDMHRWVARSGDEVAAN